MILVCYISIYYQLGDLGTGDEDAEDEDGNSSEDGDDAEEDEMEVQEDATLVDPAFKDAIKAALGDAAIPSDAEVKHFERDVLGY